LAAGLLAAGGTWWIASRQAAPSVPTLRYLTYSGRDSSPAAAPDGRTIAFSSSRDGRRRIWLEQIATGSAGPTTDSDRAPPRLPADASVFLFPRRQGDASSLYRVPSVGGEPRKVVDDALYGDFSPDGRHLAFVRQAETPTGITSIVGVADPDGGSARELA